MIQPERWSPAPRSRRPTPRPAPSAPRSPTPKGRYRIAELPAGRYEIRASLTGFRTETQTVEAAANTAADFTLGVELQEQIVVTALRRAERLQDVPATVDAFDAGLIEQAGITSMRDYVGMAPQISVVETQNIGFTFVNVRGLSQVRNSEPTVAMVVDGVLQTTGLGFSEELYDIEQVEVLKGPQGALYGRNASGGAINVTTRQPTNQFEAFARAGFGNGENMAFTGSVSGALVRDTLMGRAAVSLKDADGWRTNVTTGRKADAYNDRSFRGRLLWKPHSTVTGDLRYAYAKTEALQSQFVSNAPNFVMPPPTGGLPGLAANFDGRSNGTAEVIPGVPASIATLVGDPNNTSVGIQGNLPGRRRSLGDGGVRQDRLADQRRHAHVGHVVRRARPGRHARDVSVLSLPAIDGRPHGRHARRRAGAAAGHLRPARDGQRHDRAEPLPRRVEPGGALLVARQAAACAGSWAATRWPPISTS